MFYSQSLIRNLLLFTVAFLRFPESHAERVEVLFQQRGSMCKPRQVAITTTIFETYLPSQGGRYGSGIAVPKLDGAVYNPISGYVPGGGRPSGPSEPSVDWWSYGPVMTSTSTSTSTQAYDDVFVWPTVPAMTEGRMANVPVPLWIPAGGYSDGASEEKSGDPVLNNGQMHMTYTAGDNGVPFTKSSNAVSRTSPYLAGPTHSEVVRHGSGFPGGHRQSHISNTKVLQFVNVCLQRLLDQVQYYQR